MGQNDSNDNNSDDAKLFRDAMRDAQPIKGARRARHNQRAGPIGRERETGQQVNTAKQSAAEPAEPETVFGQRLMYKRDAVSRRLMRELSRGKMKINAELDLHGLTVDEARHELNRFLDECIRAGLRCVRIVHGKGKGSGTRGPVLKSMTNSSLRQVPNVLAFCSALERDGGTGAVYVLLSGH